jgi:cellulose biosynthesis protein BcsQ
LYVITFYSFKGGVGRTMALVNVAAELVRRGRKVLVVDFDLEAPGLETYQHLRPPKPLPGIVEYVTEFRRTRQVPNFLDYIYEAKPIGKKGGRLWVMPAGRRDRAYRSALTSLDWKRFYQDEDGFLFFEDTKKGWEEELTPDYVLIDSRTGDTDVLGICTRQLPDSVVLMFTPNEQNLAGLETVCRDIRREETEGLKKAIRLHFVAANVPDLDDENSILRRRVQAFRERLDFQDLSGVIRRYENLSLLDQTVSVLDHQRSKLARTFRQFVQTLLKDNLKDRTGALVFLQSYAHQLVPRIPSDIHSALHRKLGEKGADTNLDDPDSVLDPWQARDSLNKIAERFLDDIEIFNRIAECFILEGEFERAIRVLDWVLSRRPDLAGSLFWRALCHKSLRHFDKAAEDLLGYLRLPEQKGLDRMRALRQLHDMAPGKLLEAVDGLTNQGFLGVTRIQRARLSKYTSEVDAWIRTHGRVASLLSTTEEGVPRAAQLLRELIADLSVKEKRRALRWCGLDKELLQARCWQEMIELLEPSAEMPPDQVVQLAQAYEQMGPHELFQLALAYWDVRGEMPETLCRLALQGDGKGDPERENLEPQTKSWLLWRVGNVPEALVLLNTAEQNERGRFGDAFSLWRYRMVSVEQYLDDCQLVRRMFQGEPLRPAFLGPPRSPPPR